MTPRAQKTLAISAAIMAATIFAAANAHLLTVALRAQSECVAVANATPAKRAC